MKNNYFGEHFDVVTAVEFIENAIMVGKSGFTLNTEFGKVGVEINNVFEDTIIVVPWIDAPDTRWAMKYRRSNNDFYMAIRPGKTEAMTHARVIMAVSKAVLMTTFKDVDMPEDVVDAAIKAFMIGNENYVPSLNASCEDWAIEFMNPIVRRESSVKNLIRELIIRRDEAANKVLIRSEDILRNRCGAKMLSSLSTDPYRRSMAGIMMYMHEDLHRNATLHVIINDNRIFINDTCVSNGIDVKNI